MRHSKKPPMFWWVERNPQPQVVECTVLLDYGRDTVSMPLQTVGKLYQWLYPEASDNSDYQLHFSPLAHIFTPPAAVTIP